MNLKSKKNLGKADEPLREALQQAEPKATIQAVVVLEPDAGQTAHRPDARMSMDARESLIKGRLAELAELLGPTLQALRDLGLEVHGGRHGRTAVVKGKARDLLASLDLPAVRHVLLDRPIDLGDTAELPKRPRKA